MPQLELSYIHSQIFWLIVLFLLLFAVVNWAFFPKIALVMRTRKEKIATDIEKAEQLLEKSKAVDFKAKELLGKSREEANSLRNDIMLKNEKIYTESVASIENTIAKELAQNEEKLQRLKSSLSKDTQQYATEIAKEILVKLKSQHKIS